jgi:flagellar biogenesis protein FliO
VAVACASAGAAAESYAGESYAGERYPAGTYAAAVRPGRVAAVPVELADEPAAPLRKITPRGGISAAEGAGKSRLPSAGSVLSALAVVVLLIFGAARMWKSHGPRLANAVPGEAAEVLGRCRIEARQSLYLVRLGSRVLVLGSSNGELSALSEVTDPSEVDLIVGQCRSSGGGASSPFTRLFEARQRAERSEESAAIQKEPEPAAGRRFRGSPEQRLAERVRGRAAGEEAGRVA